jgi:hypothetical protein
MTLSHIVGVEMPEADQWKVTSRTVCGNKLAVTESLPHNEYQQAVFDWYETRVSVASWRNPLDDTWFRSLISISASDLVDLRAALGAKPLTITQAG